MPPVTLSLATLRIMVFRAWGKFQDARSLPNTTRCLSRSVSERLSPSALSIFSFSRDLLFDPCVSILKTDRPCNELIFDKLKIKLVALSQNALQMIITLVFTAVVVFAVVRYRRKIHPLWFKGKLGGMIKGMAEGIGSVRKMHNPGQFILLSIAIWLCYFYSLYVCVLRAERHVAPGQRECLTLLLFGTFGVIFSPEV